MDEKRNLFTNTASWYDMDTESYSSVDLDFYLDQARRSGGPILELACGTGRIAIPLVEAGFEVWALDLSSAMLAELARKATRLAPEARARLHVMQGSMVDFAIPVQFELVLIPFRGFQALVEDDEVNGCLRCVREHLSSNGSFVVDTFYTAPNKTPAFDDAERTDWERPDPRTGQIIRRTRRMVRIDTASQRIYPEVIYYVRNRDGSVARHVDELVLRYYYEYQLQVRLVTSGFRIDASYSSFDRAPAGQGGEILYVCRHSVGVPALG